MCGRVIQSSGPLRYAIVDGPLRERRHAPLPADEISPNFFTTSAAQGCKIGLV